MASSPHKHFWRLTDAEVLSPDRFHLGYECDCGAYAKQAWGCDPHGEGMSLFAKKLPNLDAPEVHFQVFSVKE